jgi:hypothetical protein
MGSMVFIYLVQDIEQWCDLLNTIRNIWTSRNFGKNSCVGPQLAGCQGELSSIKLVNYKI